MTKSNLCFIELSREIVDMEILVFHTLIKGNTHGYYKHMILSRHFSTWLLRKTTTSQIDISRKPKLVVYFYISLVIHFVVSLTLVTLVAQIRKNRQCFSFGTYFSGWEMRLLDEITVIPLLLWKHLPVNLICLWVDIFSCFIFHNLCHRNYLRII